MSIKRRSFICSSAALAGVGMPELKEIKTRFDLLGRGTEERVLLRTPTSALSSENRR
jgi:hypothetical protein